MGQVALSTPAALESTGDFLAGAKAFKALYTTHYTSGSMEIVRWNYFVFDSPIPHSQFLCSAVFLTRSTSRGFGFSWLNR